MSEEKISELETLHNKIYKETEEYGRTQFVSRIVDLELENQKLKEQIDDILIGCYSAIESDLNDNLEILCRKLYKYGYLQKSDGNYVLNRSYDEERCSKRIS